MRFENIQKKNSANYYRSNCRVLIVTSQNEIEEDRRICLLLTFYPQSSVYHMVYNSAERNLEFSEIQNFDWDLLNLRIPFLASLQQFKLGER